MLSKLLNQNRIFISVALAGLSLLGVILFNPALQTNFLSNFSLLLVAIPVLLAISFSNQISFLKDNVYFSFFLLIWIFLTFCCPNDFSFYGGAFFIHLIFLQLLAEEYSGFQVLNGFDIGFYAAVAILLHPPFWVFVPMILVHYFFAAKNLNILLCILGILAFAFISFEIITIFEFWPVWAHLKSEIPPQPLVWNYSFLWFVPIFIFLLFSVLNHFKFINKKTPVNKNLFGSLVVFGVFGVFYILFYGENNLNAWMILGIPVTVFLSNWIKYKKSIIYKEIVLWLFLLCVIMFKLNFQFELPSLFDRVTF